MVDFKISIAAGVIAAIVVGAIFYMTQAKDSDRDGLPDALEAKIGTNANSWDTDGDNHCDSTEHREKTNPLDKNSIPGVECCNGGGPRYCVKIR